MDGNGRWAQSRGLQRIAGHKKGVISVRSTVEKAAKLGIEALTLYCFSTENWKRDPKEIDFLMDTFLKSLFEERPRILSNNIRFRLIGDRSKLSQELVQAALMLESDSLENTGMWLLLAINYGGRAEILKAVKELVKNGINPDSITEELLKSYLYTKDIPDPDLIIRTSGEMRLSNFLIWQGAYSELIFLKKMWPDFSGKDLQGAINTYNKRNRRFGG
jgi:undecaprenyl diphosphate synthase